MKSLDLPREQERPERRGHPRIGGGNVSLGSRRIEAKVVNLSRRGLAIESLQQPRIGAEYTFALRHKKTITEVEGRVCWCVLKRTLRTPGGDVLPVFQAGIGLEADPFHYRRLLATLAREH